jgi:uncharacterized protein YuzE
MPVTVEYDPEVGAFYIHLEDEPVDTTVEAEGFVLDLGADGDVVGVELLSLRRVLELPALAERFGLLNRLAEIQQAIKASIESSISSYTAATNQITPGYITISTQAGSGESVASGSLSLGVKPRDLEPA